VAEEIVSQVRLDAAADPVQKLSHVVAAYAGEDGHQNDKKRVTHYESAA
jgi:hypothetical protein